MLGVLAAAVFVLPALRLCMFDEMDIATGNVNEEEVQFSARALGIYPFPAPQGAQYHPILVITHFSFSRFLPVSKPCSIVIRKFHKL